MQFAVGQKVKIDGGAHYGKEGVIDHYKGQGKWKGCKNCSIYHVMLPNEGDAPTFIDVPECFLK